jgi:transcriptional regulator with XRE-family HTH domain
VSLPVPSDVIKALGVELAEARQRKGLTQTQAVALLWERTGHVIGDRTLLSYEHATRALTVARLLELAETYEVPAARLLQAAIQRAGRPTACPTCGHP